ncbi:unnamed protein product, partial [Gulo gulo]
AVARPHRGRSAVAGLSAEARGSRAGRGGGVAPGSGLRARSDRGRHRPARLAASLCRRSLPRSTLAAAPGLPAAAAAPAMGEEDYYLELCDRPVHFEKANPVNCVFFDEANKQVFAVRSGGATGVVVKGPDDRNPISFRMEDKGEVKCIKFSLENKILAVQRTSKTVDFSNFIPDSSQLEYTQECK